MGGDSLGLGAILLLALLPAIGSLLGVAVAEWRQPPAWVIGGALHMAAGLATGVAAVELLPRAQERTAIWLIALALVAGSLFSIALAGLAGRLRRRLTSGVARRTLWGAYAAVIIDLFSDGLMTGSGASISRELGILLALSQVVANLPGGYAINAAFCAAGLPRKRRLGAALAYPLVPVSAAAIGFLALQGASEVFTGFVLALFAGLLLTATIEDIVPEADQPGAPRAISSTLFATGFAALLLASAYLG